MYSNKKEIADMLSAHFKNLHLTRLKVSEISGLTNSNVGRFLNRQEGVSFNTLFKLLDSFDLKLIVEDKEVDWGVDMTRLRMMPKVLFHGERIESRESIQEEGFLGRIDLFDNITTALKFIPKPCEIYEIRISGLTRIKFDVVDHPYGNIYSYFGHIPPAMIMKRTTYR